MYLCVGLGRSPSEYRKYLTNSAQNCLYGSVGVLFTHFTFKHITCVGGILQKADLRQRKKNKMGNTRDKITI